MLVHIIHNTHQLCKSHFAPLSDKGQFNAKPNNSLTTALQAPKMEKMFGSDNDALNVYYLLFDSFEKLP